jgi:hypothetical protein
MFKKYYLPTPAWARKLGDAILSAGASVATIGVAENNHTLILVSMWAGVAAKFISNLFADTPMRESQADNSSNPGDKPPGGGKP